MQKIFVISVAIDDNWYSFPINSVRTLRSADGSWRLKIALGKSNRMSRPPGDRKKLHIVWCIKMQKTKVCKGSES